MNRANVKGFTLIELLVSLLVMGLVLGIGVPTFNEFIATNRMSAAVNDLVTSLHLARGEAVKRRANVTVCPSANWQDADPDCDSSGTLAEGWVLFVDCDGAAPPPDGVCGQPNGIIDANDIVLQAHGPMGSQIASRFDTDASGTEFMSFGPTGFPRNLANGDSPAFNFELCDERGNQDTGGGIAAGRWVQITPTGRPQIFTRQGEVQRSNPLGGCA